MADDWNTFDSPPPAGPTEPAEPKYWLAIDNDEQALQIIKGLFYVRRDISNLQSYGIDRHKPILPDLEKILKRIKEVTGLDPHANPPRNHK